MLAHMPLQLYRALTWQAKDSIAASSAPAVIGFIPTTGIGIRGSHAAEGTPSTQDAP